MDIIKLINHPELLDRSTLFELRSMLALHPYYQTVRLLMLQNLYLLHDPTYDEELKRAAIYITDRKTIFKMVEAAHYQLKRITHQQPEDQQPSEQRTAALIDTFLDTIPPDAEEEEEKQPKRKPTPADATVDYVTYLLQCEADNNANQQTQEMKGQALIDSFLEQEQGRLVLNEMTPGSEDSHQEQEESVQDNNEEEYFTETLARIYIKQGRYQKALEIIQRLSYNYPQKNVYFADQIRFLEKLVINSNKNKN